MIENAPIQTVPPANAQTAGPSGNAIAALVLGVLSFLLCCGFLTGIPAIVIGKIEMTAIKEGRSSTKGHALAAVGLILGIVATAISSVVILLAIAGVIIAPCAAGTMEKVTFL